MINRNKGIAEKKNTRITFVASRGRLLLPIFADKILKFE